MTKTILALAASLALTTSASALTITDVGTGNPDYGNVTVAGYGQPWTTPILFTDSTGKTIVAFCADLEHIVYVGGGQNLPYSYGPVTVAGNGVGLTPAQSGLMGRIAYEGRAEYLAGNEDAAIGAQAAIWEVEYNVVVSSTDPSIENYIVRYVAQDAPADYALGLTSPAGWQAQIIGAPEMSTWAMMAFGLVGLGLAGHRRSARYAI